ncbi:MAG TPA: histidinol-phosphate transaminase [Candidatus Limnocylindrales bacterium]|nr:histidinol-phosphate transaminase [Candidatus Limnocylindrales bacterium]
MLKPRNALRQIREYHSPLSDDSVELRLDMNESTTGCSPRVLAKLKTLDAKTLALYPRREFAERFVAQLLGRQPSSVLLTNGADEGIDILCRAYLEPDDEMIIITPAFAMYEVFGLAAGAKVVRVPSGPEFSFPLEGVLAAITPRTRVIVITNPNNPTGTVTSTSDIIKVLKAAPDAAVLVDEAYYEFYGQSMIQNVGQISNLFIARTFSKAYGLAGMRLGALAGSPDQIRVLRRICPPFNINVFAVECLREALTDQAFVNQYVAQVKKTREWLREQLEELGFKSWPSHGNFVLVNFGEHKQAILKQMREWGIALRDRPDCEGCVRITIGKQQEMEVVVTGLKQILGKNEPPPEEKPQEEQEPQAT